MTVGKAKFPKKTIHDVPVDGMAVLVRVDFNVPIDKDGVIADDFRIRATIPTIRHLQRHNCKIILISHLGRPDGKPDQKYSLEPVAQRLVELLKEPVKFIDDCVGDRVRLASKRLRRGEVLLLENLRFHAGEEANDLGFAKQITAATSAKYFVQNGFGAVHRAHASTSAITELLPSVAGDLVIDEYTNIKSVMDKAKPPFVAVLGGAKVSDKAPVIEKLIAKADTIIVGGAMANNFLHYKGINVGNSKLEDGIKPVVDKIYKAAQAKTDNVDELILLPVDVAVAKTVDQKEVRHEVAVDDIATDDLALDIGSKSIELAVEKIASAKTVLWNGTMGIAEFDQFAHGSARIAMEIAKHDKEITSLIGGGDTADFVLGWSGGGKGFDYISTGGGASIELMAGQVLPGIDMLLDA